jgi:hypothetical protein
MQPSGALHALLRKQYFAIGSQNEINNPSRPDGEPASLFSLQRLYSVDHVKKGSFYQSHPEEAAHASNPSTIYKFAFSPYSLRISASQPSPGPSHVIIRNFHLREP